MALYTVIGLYEDGAVYSAAELADDPYAAMALAAQHNLKSDNPPLEILGAVEGIVKVIPACDDSGKSAMASDMASLLPQQSREILAIYLLETTGADGTMEAYELMHFCSEECRNAMAYSLGQKNWKVGTSPDAIAGTSCDYCGKVIVPLQEVL